MRYWFTSRSTSIALFLVVAIIGINVLFGDVSSAQNLTLQGGADSARGSEQPANLFSGDGSVFQMITNTLLFLVGAVSVIMLIIGGIRYVVSGGNQAAVTAAKNTILYAIVGVVVAFLAYAAVQFVIGSLVSGTNVE